MGGMGDTRGLVQDEKNIDHILNYINNLSHLNAVCLLFKPNDSRLNIFFRSCVNQLLTYLTPIFHPSIIFCFTNSRSTFYAPGDTGSLLREMLKQENFTDIRFERENTFCFDSESFRYLAARKCDVEFDQFVKEESTKSWTTSVAESVRLLKCIQELKPYNLKINKSMRKASLEISMLARPLMETLRLILYNQVLYDTRLTDQSLLIRTKPASIEICSNCAQRNIEKVGQFHILQYYDKKSETHQNCVCPFDERNFLIEYIVQHEMTSKKIDQSKQQLKNLFDEFLLTCDKLSYFLHKNKLCEQFDPIKNVLEKFLDEEGQIFEVYKSENPMCQKMKEAFRHIRQMRNENREKLLNSKENLSVDQLNDLINELKRNQDVDNQVQMIDKTRQAKLQATERVAQLPEIKSKVFSQLINPD